MKTTLNIGTTITVLLFYIFMKDIFKITVIADHLTKEGMTLIMMEYAVCYEKDMKDPLYLFLIDYEGKGIFTKFDTDNNVKVPNLVIDRATK